MNPVKLRAQLKKHEGVRNKMYFCTAGYPTIGVGLNLARPDAKTRIDMVGGDYYALKSGKAILTEEQIDKLLDADIKECTDDLEKYFGKEAFYAMPENAQHVLIDIRFNIGGAGIRKWPKTLASFKAGDWKGAADNIASNKLYRSQVGIRSDNLVAMMRAI